MIGFFKAKYEKKKVSFSVLDISGQGLPLYIDDPVLQITSLMLCGRGKKKEASCLYTLL